MCVKLPLKNLNSNSCPPYPTSTYNYEVIIKPKMRGGIKNLKKLKIKIKSIIKEKKKKKLK